METQNQPKGRIKPLVVISVAIALFSSLTLATAQVPKDSDPALIAKGAALFFNETFDGNGRTCGTCHRAEENFTISPAFIATLPKDDPLFVAEFNEELKDLERPQLMRKFGLILENQDGFVDLDTNFNMRGVPHTLGLSTSVASRFGPRTGWSGDGAPNNGSPPEDGTLRAFTIGAIRQHFTKRLDRVDGVDFRLPTDEELDALEAFQLSLGRQEELELPLPLKGAVASRGQEIFNDINGGKCFGCHVNAGANASPAIFGAELGNLNFNTGVEVFADSRSGLPPDDGFGTPGEGEFNTPSVVEAADTGPFFHNNVVKTIEGAVAFYNTDAFNGSPAGLAIIDATGSPIDLNAIEIIQVAGFLRVINALENIRSATDYLERARQVDLTGSAALLRLAVAEIEDGIQVLGILHLNARPRLRIARLYARIAAAFRNEQIRNLLIRVAVSALESARGKMIDDQTSQPTAEVAAAE